MPAGSKADLPSSASGPSGEEEGEGGLPEPEPGPVRLLIGHSHRLFAEALGACLADAGGIEVLADFPSEGLAALGAIRRHTPDVAFLDYWMRDMDGPVVAQLASSLSPECRVVLLVSFIAPEMAGTAQDSRVFALVGETIGIEDVAMVVRAVAGRDEYPAVLPRGIRPLDPGRVPKAWAPFESHLTPREVEVLRKLAFEPMESGAEDLGITLGTLRNHVKAILRKTGARSLVEAVAMARRRHMI